MSPQRRETLETAVAELARLSSEPEVALQLGTAAAEKVGHRFDQNRNVTELLELFKRYVLDQVVA